MPSTINADTGLLTGTTGVVIAADGSGNLALQANATTVVTLSTDRLANFTGNVSAANVAVTGVVRFNDGTTMNTAASGGGGLTWGGIQTSNFTSNVSTIYAVSTVSNPVVVTLPTSPGAGNVVQITDYARTWGANAVTLNRNGSNIAGAASNTVVNTNGASVALIYTDVAQGWIAYDGFTTPPVGAYSVNYLIVAGGGGGGAQHGAGAGGGGLITTTASFIPNTAYTITVGAGGAGAGNGNTEPPIGGNGGNSSIAGINAATGGGAGGCYRTSNAGGGNNGASGGSGGGGGSLESGNTACGYAGAGGSGTAGQGFAGANGAYAGGGGGGAGAAGTQGCGGSGGGSVGGNGGAGVFSSISGSSVGYAGGGGGGAYNGTAGAGATAFGGANGRAGTTGGLAPFNGTGNTGGGGGGGAALQNNGGNGGSGIVIIAYVGSQRGTGGTVTSSGGNTIHTFTSSGTFTA
jgi:hypothetical protein